MATYDSDHTGEQIDEAVGIVLGNKGKGGSSDPVYLDANGEAVAVTKDANPTNGSTNIVESGGVFTQLSTKLPFTSVNTSGTITTSNTSVPSCGTAEAYVESIAGTKENIVVAGTGIVKDGNYLSIDLDNDFMTTGKLDNKWSHFSPELEVGYGQDLVEEMERAKHSSFDKSKFPTALGWSGTITDDGIASGFDASATSGIGCGSPDFKNAQSWEWTSPLFKDTHTRVAADSYVMRYLDSAGTKGLFVRYANGRLRHTVLLTVDGATYTMGTSIEHLDQTKWYQAKIVFTGAEWKFYYREQGGNWIELTPTQNSSSNVTETLTTLYLGGFPWGGTYAFHGEMDLKYTSYSINGVEVFSGNKTGIDTIKADDYTIYPQAPSESTVVVSADGIASGFTTGNYIRKDNILSYSNTDELIVKFKFKINTLQSQFIYAFGNFQTCSCYVGATGALQGFFGSGNNYKVTPTNTILVGKDYSVKQILQNGKMWFEITDLSTNTAIETTPTAITDTFTYSSAVLLLGQAVNAPSFASFDGTIDLNGFEVWKNGNLIYQPTLRIPYTQTVDGKKIVDAEYRSRVEDEYNQAGYTPYYTLKTETKGNFAKTGDGVTVGNDWIASFTENQDVSYLKLPSQFKPGNKPWEMYIKCKTGSTWNTAPSLFTGTGSSGNYGAIYFGLPVGHPYFTFGLNLDNTQTGFTNLINTTFAPALNTEYCFKLAFTGTAYQIWVSNDNGNTYTLNNSLTSSVAFAQNQTAPSCIGTGRAASSAQKWYGSIDLNFFKIYVDGKLAYQAVTPPNYTLGTVRNTAIESNDNNYIKDSSQFLRQHGACTADSPITLAKPYMDTNYFVSVPTSAKSTTGFTPTVTGDYIAEGYTSL